MAEDRYRYFRVEGQELLEAMTLDALALERGEAIEAALPRLRRHAHTLKGAARVVGLEPIARLAHALEDRLGAAGSLEAPSGELWTLIDAIASALQALGKPDAGTAARAEHPEPPGPAQPESDIRSVRVELKAMDALLGGLVELGVLVDGLRRQQRSLEAASRLAASLGAGEREQAARLDRLESEQRTARAQAEQLRLVPAQVIFSQLGRAVRDAAVSEDRPARFEASGGETRLDGQVLFALRDALLHVVRNAVAHGIEPAGERRAALKPAHGQVRLHVERRGSRVAFVCEDDGRGVDEAALRRAAVAQGLLAAAEAAAASREEVLALAMRAGVSTRGAVSELAGRGVGLDVLRATVERLQGTLTLQSEPGAGTVIEVLVPISLAGVSALLVEAAGRIGALPLAAVERTLRLGAEPVARTPGGQRVLEAGEAVPLLSLARAWGLKGAEPDASAVLLKGATGRAAIAVDRVVGIVELVVRPLPAGLGKLPLVAGAAFDAEGRPLLLFEPDELVAAARRDSGPAAPEVERPAVLIVDDSLTTRMLVAGLLEPAGYAVTQAASAEEALELAATSDFRLFVVDVDMPGLDGVAFVERTRADARLARTPAVLLTGRSAPADRERGLAAGASGYFVKAEFDHVRFLAAVRALVEAPHG